MWNELLSESIFMLPGGLVLSEDRRLSEAELRPLTGYEEEWLARHHGVPSAPAVTRLLNACLVRLDDVTRSQELVRRILVGDRDFLMLQLRRMTLGEKISAVVVCPACSAQMDVDFKASDVQIDRHPQTGMTYTLEFNPGEEPGRTVCFRLPTGADQEDILGLDADSAVDVLLVRCLVDDGGEPLSAEERIAVIDAMEQLAPKIDLELDLTCPECSHTFVEPFDTTAFFLKEMCVNGDQLLREVHLLAFHYHWSESDILSLTRERRRAYLALLSEALRQD